MSDDSDHLEEDSLNLRGPMAFGIAGNAANFLLTLQFYSIPIGSDIRPILWSCAISLVSIGCLAPFLNLLGIICHHPNRVWPWLVALICITPFPLAGLMLRHAIVLRGLHLSG